MLYKHVKQNMHNLFFFNELACLRMNSSQCIFSEALQKGNIIDINEETYFE